MAVFKWVMANGVASDDRSGVTAEGSTPQRRGAFTHAFFRGNRSLELDTVKPTCRERQSMDYMISWRTA